MNISTYPLDQLLYEGLTILTTASLLSQNKEVREKGVKQIFFHFHTLKDQSVELLLIDKSLDSNRDIKKNRFYFSGSPVDIKNLGKFSDFIELGK